MSRPLPKALQQLQDKYPDIIEEIEDDRDHDNGYWVYLTDGWFSPDMESRTIHEDTVKEVLAKFRNVRPARPGE